MLRNKLTLLINTCDKFSDIWDAHIRLLEENWGDRGIDTILLTDKRTNKAYEGLNITVAGDGKELPSRVKYSLEDINTDFVLITLDDYFLTKKIINSKFERLISIMENENLDYIRLFPIPTSFRKYKRYDKLYKIKLNKNYMVNLYPGIWRKTFLEKTLRNEKLNAWQYEVSLTRVAKQESARCAMSKGEEFKILDVVRKGKILNKANKYLKKNKLYNGSRDVISLKKEIVLDLMFYGKEIVPNFLVKIVKRIMIKRGHKYFSDVDL